MSALSPSGCELSEESGAEVAVDAAAMVVGGDGEKDFVLEKME